MELEKQSKFPKTLQIITVFVPIVLAVLRHFAIGREKTFTEKEKRRNRKSDKFLATLRTCERHCNLWVQQVPRHARNLRTRQITTFIFCVVVNRWPPSSVGTAIGRIEITTVGVGDFSLGRSWRPYRLLLRILLLIIGRICIAPRVPPFNIRRCRFQGGTFDRFDRRPRPICAGFRCESSTEILC